MKHRVLLIAGIATVLASVLVSGSALATKGGNGNGQSNTSDPPSTITLNESSPHLGGTVTFTTNAVGLAGWEWAMVGVSCYQTGTLVYGALDYPNATFLLGGSWSPWLQTGGDADCVASLYAYGLRGGQETIRTLASTSFHATGL